MDDDYTPSCDESETESEDELEEGEVEEEEEKDGVAEEDVNVIDSHQIFLANVHGIETLLLQINKVILK